MAKKDEKESKDTGKDVQVQPARSLLPGSWEDVEHLFDEFINRGGWMQPLLRRGLAEFEPPFNRVPRIDVIEHDGEVVVKAELPGVGKDDVDVLIDENMLTIRASAQHDKKDEKGQYVRREMSRGEFQRTIRLPGRVLSDKASASFRDGILQISVPRAPGAKGQRIKVD